jgi:phospholipid transport system substrate-binding protein
MKRRLLLAACLLAAGALHAGEKEKAEVDRLLRHTVDGVLSVVRDPGLDRQRRKDGVMGKVRPVFDFELMAKLTLGRQHWPKLDAKQQKAFTDLFIKQLQSSYLDKVELVKDEKIEYEAPVEAEKKVSILTKVLTDKEPIRLAYRFYRAPSGWKVYDVEIQDVSLVKSYGQQYQDVLRAGTVPDLLKKMEEKIRRLEAESRKAPK